MNQLLDVKDLSIAFETNEGLLKAVSNVSFQLHENAILGIVGESGCGKSITAMSLINLLPSNAIVSSNQMLFNGMDLRSIDKNKLYEIRGKDIAIIFQEPMTSLNPLMKVGQQITEMIRLHENSTLKEAKQKTQWMMKKVGLSNVKKLYHSYTHELSGGMLQRVMIAMAMICQPKILIADEPTTALDVTIQAQILELMKQLNKENHTSIIFISHDLGVIKEMCTEVMVMYLGYCVEKADTSVLLKHPAHPYTYGLLQSIPNPKKGKSRLYAIPGRILKLSERPKGCPFCTRCKRATEKCRTQLPELQEISTNHFVRCFYPLDHPQN